MAFLGKQTCHSNAGVTSFSSGTLTNLAELRSSPGLKWQKQRKLSYNRMHRQDRELLSQLPGTKREVVYENIFPFDFIPVP